MNKLIMRAPDDWHCHLRDGDMLLRTVTDQARYFSRSIIMPNLNPPVATVAQAEKYYQRIQSCIPQASAFRPLMTLYLTDDMTLDTLREAKASPCVYAVKLYPAGATTHSDAGITDFNRIGPLLAEMEALAIPLLIHGEVTASDSDIFDRENEFIEQCLTQLVKQYPNLRIVLEHITTQEAVRFVESASDNIAATITPHHLLLNRNDLLAGGIRPHYYCLPIVKREEDQQALIEAAISGNPSFFLGTDSAPHTVDAKQSACGCAGIYSAHAALELYAEVFDQYDALERLEGFASLYGPKFYGLPVNAHTITLERKSWAVPKTLSFGEQQLVPLRAGQEMQWTVVLT